MVGHPQSTDSKPGIGVIFVRYAAPRIRKAKGTGKGNGRRTIIKADYQAGGDLLESRMAILPPSKVASRLEENTKITTSDVRLTTNTLPTPMNPIVAAKCASPVPQF
jgi:hypothetical protein